MRSTKWIALVAAVALFGACSDDESNNGNANNNSSTSNNTAPNNITDAGNNATDAANNVITPAEADRSCDNLDPSYCSLPWPSRAFLAEDADRQTGYTLTFGAESLPANNGGTHVDPEPYKRMDGYGLGAPAIALFPNIDSSGFPNEYNVAASLEDDADILLLEIAEDGTATRVPYYVDHDLNNDDPTMRPIVVRPAVILKEATRYAVAFRNLVDTDGNAIEPSASFKALLDGTGAADSSIVYRETELNEVLAIVEAQGVERDSLVLAYDWVTASSDGLHGYMLHIRDEVLTDLPNGPDLTVTSVEEFAVPADASNVQPGEDTHMRYRITGTFEAPNYIEVLNGGLLKQLRIGADGMPEADGTRTADFWVMVPHDADTEDHGLMMYGHGLFGEGARAAASFNRKIGADHNYIVYGASLWGMSETQADGDAFPVVTNLSNFPSLGDQLHQGMAEWLLLARAMRNKFPSLTEVTDRSLQIDTDDSVYSGISQGGIFGPTIVALSPDITLGHAGVPGHTYSVLLHRSVDFEPFFNLLRTAYRDTVEQLIGLHTLQILWNGTDSVSYVRKLSAEPFDEGVVNHMIFAPAKGDFQVAVHQNEVLARTPDLGIALMANYDADRSVDLVTETAYPHTGSGVVLYDFNQEDDMGMTWRNAWPEPGNLPPVRGDETCPAACPAAGTSFDRAKFNCCAGQCCYDAHELPRRRDWHNEQMVHFFRNGGEIIDVCGGDGCRPD